jgi:hypothetical protein
VTAEEQFRERTTGYLINSAVVLALLAGLVLFLRRARDKGAQADLTRPS